MKHLIQTKMFVHKFGRSLQLFQADMSEYGYLLIGTVDVEVDYELPDDFNFTQLEIDNLKKEKKRIQAEANKKLVAIDEKIQSLQCIEHKEAA